jgi:hypothetical protein
MVQLNIIVGQRYLYTHPKTKASEFLTVIRLTKKRIVIQFDGTTGRFAERAMALNFFENCILI